MATVLRRAHRPVECRRKPRSGNVVLETGRNIDRGGPDGCEGDRTESSSACQSDYATDRRSTGLALTPDFRATVMTSVAMDMPMRLLGT